MSFFERLKQDQIASLKSGNQARVDTLRLLLAALHNRAIELKLPDQELSDDEVIGVLQKEAKKRKESIGLFQKGDRADLADKESKELVVIEEFIPASLGKEELMQIIERCAAETREFGPLMKAVMQEAKGRADGKEVSALIKEYLAEHAA